jgi:hypothetical protein
MNGDSSQSRAPSRFTAVGGMMYPLSERHRFYETPGVGWPFARITVDDSNVVISARGVLQRIWKSFSAPLSDIDAVVELSSDSDAFARLTPRLLRRAAIPIRFVERTGEFDSVLFITSERSLRDLYAVLAERGIAVPPSP